MMDLARHGGVYLGADAIAAEISPHDVASAAVEAGRQFLLRFEQLVQTEERIIVESTLAGKSLARHLQMAKELGFEIKIKFIFVDAPEVSLIRVKQRVARGGRHVPDEDVRRRFCRSIAEAISSVGR